MGLSCRRSTRIPAVRAPVELARKAPRIASYDWAMRKLGGDPDAALNSR